MLADGGGEVYAMGEVLFLSFHLGEHRVREDASWPQCTFSILLSQNTLLLYFDVKL